MALSLKNTLLSLTLSGAVLFAGYLNGESPQPFNASKNTGMDQSTALVKSDAAEGAKITRKKAKRAFTTPYFSFGKSNFSAGVRQ
jgi:hypothetical protein